jgi:hypothetical protein
MAILRQGSLTERDGSVQLTSSPLVLQKIKKIFSISKGADLNKLV